MTRHFDLHDTISVMIPGACSLVLVWLFTCGCSSEGVQLLSELSVSAALLVLACCYFIGEFLQGIGEVTVKNYYRHFSGGDPLFWLLPREGKQSQDATLLPACACKDVLDHLAETLHILLMTKESLKQCFPYIKTKVYAHEVYRMECIKMLTKANFYSAIAVLFFLAPCLHLLADHCCGEDCCIVSYCLTHDIWGYYTQSAHLSCAEGLISFGLSWGIAYGCAHRYRFFNILYYQGLISAYLELTKPLKKNP